MASIPQVQISNAYYFVLRNPKEWYGFGRGYSMWYDGNHTFKLVHYGTTIYTCNTATKKVTVGGWSMSDAAAINSLAYHTGTKGVYLTGGEIYAEGTGPRYKPKASKKKKDQIRPFGL